MISKPVLVTGASGFVGAAVAARLVQLGCPNTRAAVRRAYTQLPLGVEGCVVPTLAADTDWTSALAGIDSVVHAAARVHVMRESATDPLDAFRRVNVEGTLNLARQAAQAGVRRFVFISSIKVNGEATEPGRPFRADDEPAPQDAYGVSKLEAEVGLRALAETTGMEVVIIRPVLVYGPGVRANFQALMSLVNKGVPLPFGRTSNRRSLVALDNLVDMVCTCLEHPAAAHQTFLVSDGEAVSTAGLVRAMAMALGKKPRLLDVPLPWMSRVAQALGQGAVTQRLFESLEVDIDKNRQLLGWEPSTRMADALLATARPYVEARRR
ncbi:UDP-glucose 4-epimerase family protein [Pseudomonas coleopterorum]|uniref:UDP-glucose 4-epimerase family protein n=1 Tax=Pseudomonas coleopterorum TaxID=1605838 RepID=UPI000896CDC1|nr:SDR family oxidoreductase [Pseudomonas coleopterorum]SEE34682.1 Nucleoside-diphosphate-sugar epimerase [Pseudomonas coleopterorum]